MKSATHKMSNTSALVVISHGNEQGYLMDKKPCEVLEDRGLHYRLEFG